MSYFDHPANRAKLDRFITGQLDHYGHEKDPEEFELTCLLAETYDSQDRLLNQHTLELSEYPQLTAKNDDGTYLLDRITFHFRDGSELNVTRNEP
jgi:hypothetical protein